MSTPEVRAALAAAESAAASSQTAAAAADLAVETVTQFSGNLSSQISGIVDAAAQDAIDQALAEVDASVAAAQAAANTAASQVTAANNAVTAANAAVIAADAAAQQAEDAAVAAAGVVPNTDTAVRNALIAGGSTSKTEVENIANARIDAGSFTPEGLWNFTQTPQVGGVPLGSGGGGLTVNGTKAAGRVPTVQSDMETVLWADVPAGGSSNWPYLVKPSSTSVDIGALINAALSTHGTVIIAPSPTVWWTLNTPITVGRGESISGMGQGTSRIRAGSGLGANPMIAYRNGSDGQVTVRDLTLDGNGIATYGVRFYQTAQPSNVMTNPDAVNLVQNVVIDGATLDGVYVGGSGAYSGNARETRVINCLSNHNGQYGFNIASSDCFLDNNTTHGNGAAYGGYHLVSGQAGNTKLVNCKSYYEDGVGINAAASRITIVGGEVQDCARGLHLGSDSYANLTIDTCGTASQGGVRIGGSGSTVQLHFAGRTPPGGSPGIASKCLEMQFGSSVLSGFVNTNRLGRTNDYTATWHGSNRPAAGSVLTIAPSNVSHT